MSIREFGILSLATLLLAALCETQGLNPALALVLLAATAALLSWHYQDQLRQKAKTKEQSLRTQAKISAKDASLKQQQILSILTNIPSPLAMMDSYGHVVLYNEGFSRFLTEENDQEMTYRDERIDFEIRSFLKEAYLSESAIVRNLHHNGIDFQCLSVPIYEKNRFSSCLLVFQDITQAMEKERMQKRFIADASHELKTPIAAIKGMIEILNRDGFSDPEIMTEFHHQIQKENERLEQIVADLLQLSRLSAGKTVLDRSDCDVNVLFQDAVREVKTIAQARQIELRFDNQTGDHQHFWLDGKKMHQVLVNLLTNAIVHSGASAVTLTAQDHNGQLKLDVADDGCGIDQKHLERIFERFYRIDTHRSRQSGGSGLGLAIVKAIVDAHGGEIEVTSSPGRGTRFEIMLPLVLK